MVVVNITNKDLKIAEIRSIVPADGREYILPYEIAIKYKAYLRPVQMQDKPIVSPSDEPINRQIEEMNHNAVSNFEQLEKELKNQNTDEQKQTIEETEDDVSNWGKLSKQEKIKSLWENNPSYSIKKIAEYSGASYIYAQKIVAKLKIEKEEEDYA